MACIEYPIKCLSCGLHYTVWSWNEDWLIDRKPFCPECGECNGFLGFPAKHHPDLEIFQVVPGGASLDTLLEGFDTRLSELSEDA